MFGVAPPNFDNDPTYVEAKNFAKTIEPEGGKDYGWVAEYAKDLYDRLARANKDIDEKANDIVKYLGGGSGLFALGAIAKTDASNAIMLFYAIPSFVIAVCAIVCAAAVRRPMGIDLPPSVEAAFDYASHYDMTARAAFLGQWHVACQYLVLVNGYKAKLVKLATWLFVGAIALLILPIVAAYFTAH
jgi:hypothetical protein